MNNESRIAFVDSRIPYVGSCGLCGHWDSRHRLFDSIKGMIKAGESVDFVARNFDVSPDVVAAISRMRMNKKRHKAVSKYCPGCKTVLPLDKFYRALHRSDGLSPHCKKCAYKWSKLASYRDKLKKSGGNARKYQQLFDEQGGLCAVCRTAPNGRVFHFDHDHISGAARGLLCHRCNTAIGLLRDSPELLRRAATYLVKLGG